MAVTVRTTGAKTDSGSSGTTRACTKPDGLVDGDYWVIVIMGKDDDPTVTAPDRLTMAGGD
jgi:hypothetical protein